MAEGGIGMKIWSAFAAIAVAVLVTAPAQAKDYAGPDAGTLVLSISSGAYAEDFVHNLRYRRVGEAKGGWLTFVPGTFGNTPDFETQGPDEDLRVGLVGLKVTAHSKEKGKVQVRHLAPGQYEIFNIREVYNNGLLQIDYNLKQDISIPFEIKAGRVTYLGEFKAIGLAGKNLFGTTVTAGIKYLVTDQSTRDLPIASQRGASGDVDVAVPDVDRLGLPGFSSGRGDPAPR
jgi:hypothetical protein